MPTYQYRCTECGDPLEVVQKFSDDPLTECPSCEGRLRKVFSAVGVVFKGSGFYKTDSRAARSAGKAGADAAADSGATSDTTKSAGSEAAKTDGKDGGKERGTGSPKEPAQASGKADRKDDGKGKKPVHKVA